MNLLASLFIDGSYLYKGMKEAGVFPFNMSQLADTIIGEVGRIGDFGAGAGIQRGRIYYYNAPLNQAEDPGGYKGQQKFFARLKQQQIILRLGNLKNRPVKFVCPRCLKRIKVKTYSCPDCEGDFEPISKIEKGVDVRIAVDIMSLAAKSAYNIAILVSGDGDFAPLAREVREHWNVYFWNVHFRLSATPFSQDLLNECDGFVVLTKDLAEPARIIHL